jgi:hypothetical protein
LNPLPEAIRYKTDMALDTAAAHLTKLTSQLAAFQAATKSSTSVDNVSICSPSFFIICSIVYRII